MKRTPLAAIVAIAIAAGIWAYQSETRPLGEVHAQNTTVAAPTAPPGPLRAATAHRTVARILH